MRTNQLHVTLHHSPLYSLQASPRHYPLWKSHQHFHCEARDPPSHLLCLLWDPSESHFLSCGSLC